MGDIENKTRYGSVANYGVYALCNNNHMKWTGNSSSKKLRTFWVVESRQWSRVYFTSRALIFAMMKEIAQRTRWRKYELALRLSLQQNGTWVLLLLSHQFPCYWTFITNGMKAKPIVVNNIGIFSKRAANLRIFWSLSTFKNDYGNRHMCDDVLLQFSTKHRSIRYWSFACLTMVAHAQTMHFIINLKRIKNESFHCFSFIYADVW